MSDIKRELPFDAQLKLRLLSKEDQRDVLNSDTLEEALAKLNNKKQNIRLNSMYEPKLHVSGSSLNYKTKNMFTGFFDESDVKCFIQCTEMSYEPEIIAGELKSNIKSMAQKGRQALQCMVYATKYNEKNFYNNENLIKVWARVIADTVNDNPSYVASINHMLVNWGMWKNQIILLITACLDIKQNEKLDSVIRDLYLYSEDDKLKFTLIRKFLHGLNIDNYKAAFIILQQTDFTGGSTDRKYYNALRRKVTESTPKEIEALYKAFKITHNGFDGKKQAWIKSLFKEEDNMPYLIRRINESTLDQKESVLKEVRNTVFDWQQKKALEFVRKSKNIKQYKTEIQEILIQKISEDSTIENIKPYGLAIGFLDLNSRNRKGIYFLENQIKKCDYDKPKQLVFSYVLATFSDKHVSAFIDNVLQCDVGSKRILSYVKSLPVQGKNQLVREHLYNKCLKIKEECGLDSEKFIVALQNIGEFLKDVNTGAIYDIKFDQLLFEFLGYDSLIGDINKNRCTARNFEIVLEILKHVMDKSNYKGRYMKFMENLFLFFKKKNISIADKIDAEVKKLTGQGFPAI